MKLKNTLISLSVIVILVGLFIFYKSDIAKAMPSYFSREQTNSATSTVSKIGYVATTTIFGSFMTYDVDRIDLFMQFTPASTTAALNWSYEFSNNNIDWYGEDAASLSVSTYTHSTTTAVHSWVVGSTATSTKVVTIPAISSNFTRIKFTTASLTATSSIWAEATLKRNAN